MAQPDPIALKKPKQITQIDVDMIDMDGGNPRFRSHRITEDKKTISEARIRQILSKEPKTASTYNNIKDFGVIEAIYVRKK